MNLNEGFRRISAVFWGLGALIVLGVSAWALWQDPKQAGPIVAWMVGAAFFFAAAHRLSCWIIDGFSRK